MQVDVDPDGAAMASKVFDSRQSQSEEGKAILQLSTAKAGQRTVGRFEVAATESQRWPGVISITIKPLPIK